MGAVERRRALIPPLQFQAQVKKVEGVDRYLALAIRPRFRFDQQHNHQEAVAALLLAILGA
jgi:hypothetical protein